MQPVGLDVEYPARINDCSGSPPNPAAQSCSLSPMCGAPCNPPIRTRHQQVMAQHRLRPCCTARRGASSAGSAPSAEPDFPLVQSASAKAGSGLPTADQKVDLTPFLAGLGLGRNGAPWPRAGGKPRSQMRVTDGLLLSQQCAAMFRGAQPRTSMFLPAGSTTWRHRRHL